ncbi:hypothetical protein KSF_102150 [Reticulibacter mediterranei]|uniref:Uncharacterized protein n=1 Tax=Reticulibacter mediterranei TaxID=2778369 RepID=A0A8J3J0M2_9CHLR|nr:hypothetical protein KSF_102150 [Reticulibacter mediterranei]
MLTVLVVLMPVTHPLERVRVQVDLASSAAWGFACPRKTLDNTTNIPYSISQALPYLFAS